MKKDRALQVAYMAGLFDGEGCIICLRRTDKKTNHYRIALQVWMCSYQWVDHFIGQFGGKVRMAYGGTKKPGWIWDLQGLPNVKTALKTMLPFLKVKKTEAEFALRLIDRVIVGNRDRLKQGVKGIHGGTTKYSDHEIQQRQLLIDAIKDCKNVKFGYPKCISEEERIRIRAAVETKYNDKVRILTLKS